MFGILRPPGRPIDLAGFEAAGKALRHRGPDDEGYLLANSDTGEFQAFGGPDSQQGVILPRLAEASGAAFNMGFCFRRLSIVDLSEAGHQPMERGNGAYWMVFNGEIYNHRELSDTLKSAGFQFRSTSDSEVLLAAYQHWGVDCFRRFVGMWAVAIWDVRERKLVLARDQFGIKPLYLSFADQRLVFGSELKSLLASGLVPRVVDPSALRSYLTHGRPGLDDRALVRGIRQVPPGHVAIVDLHNDAISESNLDVRAYWSVDEIEPREITYAAAVEEVRETFLQSIRLHLRADVPVAVNVSGGVDSSSVLMAARKTLGRDVPIHAFSFIADEAFLSEEKWIDIVGKAAGAQVHKVRPDTGELIGDMSKLLAAQDEPIGSISPYAQYRVFQLAHENGIKVTLDGQGADEYLAGYDRYHVMALASAIQSGDVWRGLRGSPWRSQGGPEPRFAAHCHSAKVLTTSESALKRRRCPSAGARTTSGSTRPYGRHVRLQKPPGSARELAMVDHAGLPELLRSPTATPWRSRSRAGFPS
ncbi:MAG: asparagine synthase (glutamine-hydrolyzing) [Hyphomicrobiaceae bacterium]